MSIIYPDVDALVGDLAQGTPPANITAVQPLVYDPITGVLTETPASSISNGYLSNTAQTIGGVKDFIAGFNINGGQTITSISIDTTLSANSDSILSTQKAIKQYVANTIAYNVNWLPSCINFWDASTGLPISPSNGNSYICSVAGNGWLLNYIYRYSGTWVGSAPVEGDTVYLTATDYTYNYNGTSWNNIGLSINQFSTGTFSSMIDSTSTNSGTLIVAGGVGIAKNIYVGGTSHSLNNTVTDSPNGFENQTDSTITYSGATQTITVTPTATSFNVWVNGLRYVYSTPQTLIHTNTAGNYYFYFDATGFKQSTSIPSFFSTAICAIVTYLGSNVGFVCEERHGCIMDPATHMELHEQVGTYLVSGCVASNYLLQPTSPTDAGNQFALSSGVISDETLLTNISALVGGTYNVNKLTGANALWTYTSLTVPFNYTTTGYIEYNNYNGSTWVSTPATNNEYVNYYIIAVNSLSSATQIFIKPSNSVYSTLQLAQAETFASLTTSSYAPVEYVPIYQITFKTLSSYTTLGKCRIEAVTKIVGSKATLTMRTQINNHNSLLGLQLADTGVTWGHINDTTQSIYGAKSFKDTTSAGATAGALRVNGGVSIGTNLYVNNGIRADTSSLLYGLTVVGQLQNVGNTILDGIIHSNLTTNSTDSTTGALIIAGGVGISKDLYVNGSAYFTGAPIYVDAGGAMSGTYTFYNTNQSSSVGTGSVLFKGGLGIEKNVYIGGDLNVTGTIYGTISGSASTADSTSPTTGSIIVAGGIGVAKNEVVGASVTSGYNNNNSAMTFYATYQYSYNGGFGSGNLSGKPVGTVAITNGTLDCSARAGYVSYVATGLIDSNPQVGAIKLKYTPAYSGAPPVSHYDIISVGTPNAYTNEIVLEHQYGGALNLIIYSSAGGLIVGGGAPFGGWSPVSGTTYEMEIDWNLTSGYTSIFIDGVKFGNSQTNTGSRTACTQINVGSGMYDTGSYTKAYISDVIIYNAPQHTANYTAGYTIRNVLNTYGSSTLQGVYTSNLMVGSSDIATTTVNGAFTGSWTQTVNGIKFKRVLGQVTMMIPDAYFNSISGQALTSTGLVPVGYRPSTMMTFLCHGLDYTIDEVISVEVYANGNVVSFPYQYSTYYSTGISGTYATCLTWQI